MLRALPLCGLILLTIGTARADASGLAILRGAGAPVALTAQDLAALPVVKVSLSFEMAQGRFRAAFTGPLLWTVLAHEGAVDPAKPRQQAGQTILVTGHDGYAAALAMGEISPAFEGKPVILAESMNGHPLGEDHLRLIVPGDARGARDVKDVGRIAVSAPFLP